MSCASLPDKQKIGCGVSRHDLSLTGAAAVVKRFTHARESADRACTGAADPGMNGVPGLIAGAAVSLVAPTRFQRHTKYRKAQRDREMLHGCLQAALPHRVAAEQ